MGTVHDLIETGGRAAALIADRDRREVEAATAYMADEDGGIGFLFSGWCQAALPHRRLPDDRPWQIQGERVTLVVQPGLRPTRIGALEPVGVPFGSRGRLIMFYLQSQALKTGSREVELGRSLREWLARMGIPQGGKSIAGVREQAERISRCRLTFHLHAGNHTGLVNQNIVDTAIFLDADDRAGGGSLFVERARLSEVFYEQLRRHPVPIEDAAIRAISNNSMALDAYAWLAYRLHALQAPRTVSWKALKEQFGHAFGRMDNFKMRFLETLRLALAVYRAARVDVEDRGLVLHPSPPAVPKAEARWLGIA
jgi:hypothetical protein